MDHPPLCKKHHDESVGMRPFIMPPGWRAAAEAHPLLVPLRDLAQLLQPGASTTDIIFGASLVAKGDGDLFASLLFYIARHGNTSATAAQAVERAIRYLEVRGG